MKPIDGTDTSNIRQKSDHLIVAMKRMKVRGAKGMASQ